MRVILCLKEILCCDSLTGIARSLDSVGADPGPSSPAFCLFTKGFAVYAAR